MKHTKKKYINIYIDRWAVVLTIWIYYVTIIRDNYKTKINVKLLVAKYFVKKLKEYVCNNFLLKSYCKNNKKNIKRHSSGSFTPRYD